MINFNTLIIPAPTNSPRILLFLDFLFHCRLVLDELLNLPHQIIDVLNRINEEM